MVALPLGGNHLECLDRPSWLQRVMAVTALQAELFEPREINPWQQFGYDRRAQIFQEFGRPAQNVGLTRLHINLQENVAPRHGDQRQTRIEARDLYLASRRVLRPEAAVE